MRGIEKEGGEKKSRRGTRVEEHEQRQEARGRRARNRRSIREVEKERRW